MADILSIRATVVEEKIRASHQRNLDSINQRSQSATQPFLCSDIGRGTSLKYEMTRFSC